MRDEARRRIDALPDDLVVLDVGGWAAPLWRADWVIDTSGPLEETEAQVRAIVALLGGPAAR